MKLLLHPILFPPRSLFASFFGNIVGALLVALPATYYYYQDYRVDEQRTAEHGEIFHHPDHRLGYKENNSDVTDTKQH